MITPLTGQQALVRRLLDHWGRGHGGQQNPCRREALEGVRVVDNLAEASRELEKLWGTPPALVATSARSGTNRVRFDEARTRLGSAADPAILVFGTGWGLAPEALESCHWILDAVRGADNYNHLSVRSAASIVVDRLFGER